MATPEVRLHLFGTPTVQVGGAVFALPFERRTQTCVLLALRGQWVPRAEVAATLWPEQPSRLAFANLRKTLFRLASLPWPAAVLSEGTALRYEVATDVAAFETALRERRPDDALAAYRGDLLAGFDDGESEAWTRWLAFERDRLRAAWRDTALARLDAGLEPADAIALSARLLESDPLDEAALTHHVQALARDGRGSAARQVWRSFVDRLSDDLGLEPGAELRALHDAIAAPARPTSPPGPAAAPAPNDGFIGRSAELRRMAELLARDDCRALCLVGPGGVGKTRLARRALQDLAAGFADGAHFVALDDVDTPERFGLRLAQAAGIAGGAVGDHALARAIDAWRDRHAIVVLDNFEQLAGETQALETLLDACPHLKLVITSRVRITLAGGWSMPLDGLPCPDPEDVDHAESFDAVRLFVRAALRVEPAFIAAAESAAIVSICRQTEGLPLALELAAAWVRVLSCQAIADELREGTELLRATEPGLPSRHASMEAVFEQSWRRLGAAERDALARLSVFHGGFSVEAARAVAGASLPVLGALVDKSLLSKDRTRMHLHPLVQQLAALRLEPAERRLATEAAHAEHFHRWLHRLEPAAASGQREALEAIDTEFENCRRAWRFSIAQGHAEPLAHSVTTLRHYFEDRARFDEGLALSRQVLDAPLGRTDGHLRALMLSHAALMANRLARFPEAQSLAQEVLAVARGARDREPKFRAHAVLGGSLLVTGRGDEARRHYQQALALAQADARAHDIAATLDNLALCEKWAGRYEDALRLTEDALAQHRRHGDQARVATCLCNLGSLLAFMDDDEAARAHLHEALQISERLGLVGTRAYVLANLTELALKADDAAAAQAHASVALEVADAGGLRSLAAWLRVQLSRLAVRRGAPDAARELLRDATEAALAFGLQSVKAAVLLAFAELLEAQGQPGAARRVLGFAADESTLGAPDRDELRAAWARRASPTTLDPPWPGLSITTLLQRVISETGAGHAALIVLLQTPA